MSVTQQQTMDNGQWTMDNGRVKEVVPISSNFVLKKTGVVPCELDLSLKNTEIIPINLNGNATLKVSTKTGTLSITSNREEMASKLWELLARVEPLSIESINQAVTLLEAIITINPDALETTQAMQTLQALKAILRKTKG